MYLLDTNIISELRKKDSANPRLKRFVHQLAEQNAKTYISSVTVGELRCGIDLIRHRGDLDQARALETWLQTLMDQYAENILDFGKEEAQIWGRLRVPHPENALDKQIAATALSFGFTLATRNVRDFVHTDVILHNPFEPSDA